MTSKKPLKCATPFLPQTLKPSSFFLLQQLNDMWLWHACNVQKESGECCGMGRRQGGLSLRVKRDERVGLMVGWGRCECDGLVSNTLSLSMSATPTHPSMVSHSPVCFKAIVLLPLQSVCLCCCVVPLFALCPILSQRQLSLGMM